MKKAKKIKSETMWVPRGINQDGIAFIDPELGAWYSQGDARAKMKADSWNKVWELQRVRITPISPSKKKKGARKP